MKAWLITWKWIGKPMWDMPDLEIVLSARTGPEQVRRYVERVYADSRYSPQERLDMARYNKPSPNPYPAEFVRIGKNNVPWQGRITCGHDPYLYARLVRDLRVVFEEDGREHLDWSEIPMPEFPEP